MESIVLWHCPQYYLTMSDAVVYVGLPVLLGLAILIDRIRDGKRKR